MTFTDVLPVVTKIAYRVMAWALASFADGKVTAEEWEKLATVILQSLVDAGVEVDWLVEKDERGRKK